MNEKKLSSLESAGWKFGDASDFLGVSDDEKQLLDTHAALALALRHQREFSELSQKRLGPER